MSDTTESIRQVLLSRSPVIYLMTWEEGRAVRILEAFTEKMYPGRAALTTWSCVSGFSGSLDDASVLDPVAAIRKVQETQEKGFYVLRDLSAFMDDSRVCRALREAYAGLQASGKYLFITSPELQLPELLKKEIQVVEMGLPDENELAQLVQGVAQAYPKANLPAELISDVSFALKGLTLNEAGHSLHRVLQSGVSSREKVLAEVTRDKEMVVRKAGYLELVPTQHDIDHIGGLGTLKEWLIRRQELFSRDALGKGLPLPKGMLVMGMSGCGKSIAAKAVAHLWRVPLFRLDMNLVSSGIYGTPEAAFHRALKTMESLAPGVLWIDEIENSLGMEVDRSDSNPRIFSSFLTWMQEKPPLIFVAATANRIQALPAEVIRKGRFDEVFFIDLPTIEERREIFEVHLKRNGADPSQFDLELLGIATKGWNGAEIEQALAAARADAYHEGRELTMSDVTRNSSTIVPLSKTMHEQMKKIRSWAFGRATPASKYKRTSEDA